MYRYNSNITHQKTFHNCICSFFLYRLLQYLFSVQTQFTPPSLWPKRNFYCVRVSHSTKLHFIELYQIFQHISHHARIHQGSAERSTNVNKTDGIYMQELSEAPEDMTTREWWSVLCVNTKGGMDKKYSAGKYPRVAQARFPQLSVSGL